MTIKNKDEIIAELEAELKKYKDMAAKGLEEFKDVGGCWGCGLQLQLNQDLEDIKHLKAENERLKRENEIITGMCNSASNRFDKIYQTLQEIKTIAEKLMADNLCNNCDGIGLDANCQDTGCPYYQMDKILQKITKVEEE